MSTYEKLLSIVAPHGQQHLLAFWDRLTATRAAFARRANRGNRFQPRGGSLPGKRRVSTTFTDWSTGPVRRPDSASTGRPIASRPNRPGSEDRGRCGGPAGNHPGGGRAGNPARIRPSQGDVSDRAGIRAAVVPDPRGEDPRFGPAARRRIPLYLMTSPATHQETVEFFAENGRFGLPARTCDLLPGDDAGRGCRHRPDPPGAARPDF